MITRIDSKSALVLQATYMIYVGRVPAMSNGPPFACVIGERKGELEVMSRMICVEQLRQVGHSAMSSDVSVGRFVGRGRVRAVCCGRSFSFGSRIDLYSRMGRAVLPVIARRRGYRGWYEARL